MFNIFWGVFNNVTPTLPLLSSPPNPLRHPPDRHPPMYTPNPEGDDLLWPFHTLDSSTFARSNSKQKRSFEGWALKGGRGLKFRVIFSLPPQFSFPPSLSWGSFSWNCGGVFEGQDPLMCTFGVLGSRVKPRQSKQKKLFGATPFGPHTSGPSPPTPTHIWLNAVWPNTVKQN